MSSVILTAVCAIRNLWSNALGNSEKHNSVCFWPMISVTLCSWHLRSSKYPELGSNSSSSLAVWLLVYWVNWLSFSRVKMTCRVVVRPPTGIYSWLLNNRSLNCMDPLTYGIFPFSSKYWSTAWSIGWIHRFGTVDTEEPSIWRSNYKLYVDFQLHGGSATLTLPPYCSAVHQALWIASIYWAFTIYWVLCQPHCLI